VFQFETCTGIKKARVFLDNFDFIQNKSLISILDHFFPCFLPETVKDILAKSFETQKQNASQKKIETHPGNAI